MTKISVLEHLEQVVIELNKQRPALHARAYTETRKRAKWMPDDQDEMTGEETFEVTVLTTDFGDLSGWDVKEEHTNYSKWRSKPNGKQRFSVGFYGDRKSFPQRKDGSFNYEEIAQMLIRGLDRQHTRQAKEQMAISNRHMTERVREKVGYGVFKWVNSSETHAGQVSVEVGAHSLTEDQALELFELLQKFKAENKG